MFSNVEEALRAARLMARLAIVDCKMTSVVPDFINNDAPPSRELRDSIFIEGSLKAVLMGLVHVDDFLLF